MLNQNKFTIVLVIISILMAGIFGWEWIRSRKQITTLVIATGSKKGEYYAFAQALAEVIALNNNQIKIEVLETNGSRENEQLLREKKVEMAIVQGDTPLSPSARSIRFLFPETFHLIASKKSNIQNVEDLRGKRVGIMPEGSGSNALFWPLSYHYGITEIDFEPVMLPYAQAQEALNEGDIDALFQVIALRNSAISELLANGQNYLVPIDQAEALQLTLPALEATTIPKGTYNGAIPIPETNLPAVGVRAILLTHRDVDPNIIHEITRILSEEIHEIIQRHPPSVLIGQDNTTKSFAVAYHEGARAYYNQDQPSFLERYAESMGFIISVSMIVFSGFWQLKLFLESKQKNRADSYNLDIMELINKIESTEDIEELQKLRDQLFNIFQLVVKDLDKDKISQESFQSFTFPWEVAINNLCHKELLLFNLEQKKPISMAQRTREQETGNREH